MYKIITSVYATLMFFNASSQVTFDIKLSETSSHVKIKPHTEGNVFADSLIVKGYIALQKKGICGDICAGGTIKFELSEKIEGYPHSYIYIVTSCVTGEPTEDNIELFITKYFGNEKECYYKDVVEVIDSKGIPYYKISEKETAKTINIPKSNRKSDN